MNGAKGAARHEERTGLSRPRTGLLRAMQLRSRKFKNRPQRQRDEMRRKVTERAINFSPETTTLSLAHGNRRLFRRAGNAPDYARVRGWGGRDRTSEWRNQNPLPYRLATPHRGP